MRAEQESQTGLNLTPTELTRKVLENGIEDIVINHSRNSIRVGNITDFYKLLGAVGISDFKLTEDNLIGPVIVGDKITWEIKAKSRNV